MKRTWPTRISKTTSSAGRARCRKPRASPAADWQAHVSGPTRNPDIDPGQRRRRLAGNNAPVCRGERHHAGRILRGCWYHCFCIRNVRRCAGVGRLSNAALARTFACAHTRCLITRQVLDDGEECCARRGDIGRAHTARGDRVDLLGKRHQLVLERAALGCEEDKHFLPVAGFLLPAHVTELFHPLEGGEGRWLHDASLLTQFALREAVLLPKDAQKRPMAE